MNTCSARGNPACPRTAPAYCGRGLLPLLVLVVLLGGCTAPATQAQMLATAQVTGCWPGNAPTPFPRVLSPVPGIPTATTALPATTPLPRCTPVPGQPTLIPFPTPLPPRPPFPTRVPDLEQGGSAQQNTLTLPGQLYQMDVAVHPTEGWPVVAAMQQWSSSTDGTRVYARVYNPHSNRWGDAQQMDIGASSTGDDRFASIAVAVTGRGEVVAVWGVDDVNGGIWTVSSTDYGTSWTEPQQIATNCWGVHGVAATPDGQVVVLASGYTGSSSSSLQSRAILITRSSDGQWRAPDTVSAPGWFGALVMVGDGANARAVALTTSHADPNNIAYVISGAPSGGWHVQQRTIGVPGAYFLHLRGLTWGVRGVAFTFHGQYRASAYALVSSDAGQSWGDVETIFTSDDTNRDGDVPGNYVTPLYDARANRLVAIWTKKGTHYAHWSVPGSEQWTPVTVSGAEGAIPIISGARDATITVSAQAANHPQGWLAWVEDSRRAEVRSFDLNQLVPIEQYPLPTAQPTPPGETP